MISSSATPSHERVVSIVGFGLIGKERGKALERLYARGLPVRCGKILEPHNPAFLDQAHGLGPACASATGASSFDEVVASKPDLIIIACPHDTAAEYASYALARGVPVLLEKPLGRSAAEAQAIAQADPQQKLLHVGFNYRYMPGVQALIDDCQKGVFGDLISLTLQLGHGGSPQDRTSWKLDPHRCGGGVLLDPGVHLLDLLHCFGDSVPWTPVAATSWSGFWNTGIEEESHILLTAGKVLANLQISVVRWRSSFTLNVLGSKGYGIVNGRGRSYGPQTYIRGERWGWQNHPSQAASEVLVSESNCEDSFADELAACLGFAPRVNPLSGSPRYIETMTLYDDILKKLEVRL